MSVTETSCTINRAQDEYWECKLVCKSTIPGITGIKWKELELKDTKLSINELLKYKKKQNMLEQSKQASLKVSFVGNIPSNSTRESVGWWTPTSTLHDTRSTANSVTTPANSSHHRKASRHTVPESCGHSCWETWRRLTQALVGLASVGVCVSVIGLSHLL